MRFPFKKWMSVLALLCIWSLTATYSGEPLVINYEESKIPSYKLPNPLVSEKGTHIQTASAWNQIRRPELLALFTREMYGAVPKQKAKADFIVTSDIPDALNGLARRKEVVIRLSGDEEKNTIEINVLLYLPAKNKNPAPVFLGYNFNGNHTIHKDPGITLSASWVRDNASKGVKNNKGTEASRGTSSNRWPVEMIINSGYGLATAYYGDVDPDYHDGWQNGVHPLFYRESQKAPEPHQWGSIAAWAWGLSRIMDYLESDTDIAGEKVSVMGHSRLGKTSLWAGANDTRFALVISNNSGCGGAALSRRAFGETIRRINSSFPHWFCGNFAFYNDRESLLPVDQHQLIALIAPRPVYIASAKEDQWADPKGEFLSGVHADPVYRLLGKKGISTTEMPEINKPVGDTIRYHIRAGKHDVTNFDWEQYLQFADQHLK